MTMYRYEIYKQGNGRPQIGVLELSGLGSILPISIYTLVSEYGEGKSFQMELVSEGMVYKVRKQD